MIKGLLVVSFVILAMSADADYTDPTTWGGDCDGMRQSPINIETREVEFCPWNVYFGFQAPCQDFYYNETGQALTVEAVDLNFLHVTRMNMDPENMSQFFGGFSLYSSLQFHYHAPSQHTINGMQYDLELHLVHAYSDFSEMYLPNNTNDTYFEVDNTTNELAVIGILFKVDKEIEEDVFDRFPEEDGMANIRAAFECIGDRYFYHYEGSLTTPPCTETVEWFVLRDPLPIRPENLVRFKEDLNGGQPNNRPVQEVNNRTIGLINAEEHCIYYNAMKSFYEENHMDMDDDDGFFEEDSE